MKKGVLKNFSNFKGRHLGWSLFLIKLKRDSNTDIFCEICEAFKNTYFEERLRATASKLLFLEQQRWLIQILALLILQIRSKRQKQPVKIDVFKNFTKFK